MTAFLLHIGCTRISIDDQKLDRRERSNKHGQSFLSENIWSAPLALTRGFAVVEMTWVGNCWNLYFKKIVVLYVAHSNVFLYR
jgi:hypothetical protein